MHFVFDSQWVEDLKARYQQLPNYRRPRLYYLATQPKLEEERRKIEQWVAQTPISNQEILIKRLRNPDQFFTTYNELVVGDLLRQCGHQLEYEKRFGSKTPDWYIAAKNELSGFVVEVATIFPTKQLQAEMQSWDELRYRLGEIEHYFHLWLSSPSQASLAGKKIKPIVQFVKEWLNTFDPKVTRQSHEITYQDGKLQIKFALIPRKTEHKKAVEVAGPTFTQWVNVELLRDTISKKLKKYREVKDMNIPLVVAIVPTFSAGFDEETLLDALFGQEQMQLSMYDDEIVDTQMTRDRRGIIAPRFQDGQPVVFNTSLSAVLWLQDTQEFKAKIVHNPYASNPIPPQAFLGFPNLITIAQDNESMELKWVIP
ncbi:MAG: hypothetical protein HS126_37010 [Anaerolineales bacterium]|nr:hypothetical protein [Anaerolineales bacterium]